MSTTTPNYGLIKPNRLTEYARPEESMNPNMDTIDAAIKTVSDRTLAFPNFSKLASDFTFSGTTYQTIPFSSINLEYNRWVMFEGILRVGGPAASDIDFGIGNAQGNQINLYAIFPSITDGGPVSATIGIESNVSVHGGSGIVTYNSIGTNATPCFYRFILFMRRQNASFGDNPNFNVKQRSTGTDSVVATGSYVKWRYLE